MGDGRDDGDDDYDFKGINDVPEIEQKDHKYSYFARSAMCTCTGRNHVRFVLVHSCTIFLCCLDGEI